MAAAVAFVVTLRADFLAHPAWLAVQKADFILGPIGVGLYWLYRRPGNRLGLLLIVLGLFGAAYIGTSIDDPWPFGLGIFWEIPIVFLTEAAILMFPSGRLDGRAERWILVFWALTFVAGRTTIWLTSPQSAPWFSISACHGACPDNAWAISAPLGWAPELVRGVRAAVIVGAVATIALLVWKFVSGTPPRRRALAIGAPIALLYLVLQVTYQGLQLFTPANASASAQPVKGAIDWAFAGARSAVWYGFLFALIAAELFAGRVLRTVVNGSLGRPSLGELEGLLREPLGDPGLRLGFWRASTREWVGHDDMVLGPPRAGQELTQVQREGQPAVAIVHDAQLSEDPELLQAALAAALLAYEHAELDAAWKTSLRELRDSRGRLATAADRERRKLERDLHDGAQQRLMAIQVKLRMAGQRVEDDELAAELEAIGADAAASVEELRTLAHGIYPQGLRDFGIADALRGFAMTAPTAIRVADHGIGRCPRPVEAAIYFCSMEAVQNATKHAGTAAHVTITLGRDGEGARFEIADDGVGMDERSAATGEGLTGMRDRIGAVGGDLQIISAPGEGTAVRGTVPLNGAKDAR